MPLVLFFSTSCVANLADSVHIPLSDVWVRLVEIWGTSEVHYFWSAKVRRNPYTLLLGSVDPQTRVSESSNTLTIWILNPEPIASILELRLLPSILPTASSRLREPSPAGLACWVKLTSPRHPSNTKPSKYIWEPKSLYFAANRQHIQKSSTSYKSVHNSPLIKSITHNCAVGSK